MTTDRDQLREALAVLIEVFKNPHGTRTPDYGEVSGDGFQMMSRHPDPVAVANALSRLPDILAALATPGQAVMDERERCRQLAPPDAHFCEKCSAVSSEQADTFCWFCGEDYPAIRAQGEKKHG